MNIFFICTGNTCRSPMAEAILSAKELPDVEVRSAGLFAGEAPLSANAQAVLEEQGIEFEHTSKSLEPADVQWASLILTMTESHKRLVMQTYPEASDKIFSLKEFVEGKKEDVSDPYGGSLSTYNATFNELKRLLDQLAGKIVGE